MPFGGDDTLRPVLNWFAQADASLLGRRTYEIQWPQVTDPAGPVRVGLYLLD